MVLGLGVRRLSCCLCRFREPRRPSATSFCKFVIHFSHFYFVSRVLLLPERKRSCAHVMHNSQRYILEALSQRRESRAATSRIAAFLVSLTAFEKLLEFAGNLSD